MGYYRTLRGVACIIRSDMSISPKEMASLSGSFFQKDKFQILIMRPSAVGNTPQISKDWVWNLFVTQDTICESDIKPEDVIVLVLLFLILFSGRMLSVGTKEFTSNLS